MRCPNCDNRLLQKSGGKTRVRTQGPLVFNGDGKCRTKCYWCGSPVEVPLELQKGLKVQAEKYVLARKVDSPESQG